MPNKVPDTRPASERWAEQQMAAERERTLMRRIIGVLALALLLFLAFASHALPWPF